MLIIAVQLWLIYFGGSMFRTSGIPFGMLPEILALSAGVIPADMIRKLIIRKKDKNTGVLWHSGVFITILYLPNLKPSLRYIHLHSIRHIYQLSSRHLP